MTIVTARIYYRPRREHLEQYLSFTHWGFADWFNRRLKPIREQLRGPEAKGVDIVNFMLGDAASPSGQWRRVLNVFEFNYACDLEPLRDQPPIENIERLMRFTGAMASEAPWPQVRAVGEALARPLTDAERVELMPFLEWPREPWLKSMGYAGATLETARKNARQQMAPLWAEARYLEAKRARCQ